MTLEDVKVSLERLSIEELQALLRNNRAARRDEGTRRRVAGRRKPSKSPSPTLSLEGLSKEDIRELLLELKGEPQ